MSEIKRRIATGAAWMVLFRFFDRGVGVASMIVLARLLVPADFGLVAMATAIIAVLELLGGFGIDVAIIQRSCVDRSHYDAAWTFNVFLGCFLSVLAFASASPAASFYNEPRLIAILHVLAIGSLIRGFGNIGVVDFRRDLRFHREFTLLAIKRVGTTVLTLILAFTTRSYWALIFGTIAGALLGVVLSYVMHPYRPRFSVRSLRELFGFSKWMFATNVINFVNQRATDFVIGKLAGPEPLGVYRLGYEIANLPTSELVAPINRAAFPGYSRLAGDIGELRKSFMGITSMIGLVTVPIGCGIALTAPLLVPVVLGAKWIAAVPLIQILAFYGIITALQGNIGYVYWAMGQPRIVTVVAALQTVVMVIALALLVPSHGALGAAWAFFVTALVMAPVNQILVVVKLRLPTRGYLAKIARPLIGATVMSVAISLVRNALPAPIGVAQSGAALAGLVLLGAVTYIGIVLVLWRLAGCPDGAERLTIALIGRPLVRVFGR